MAADDLVELKFRLFDGTDIGPNKYDPSTTVGSLKEIILDRWPQDKEIAPKTVNDVKLINGGKILENNRTIAESRVPVGELPGGVITMHVVIRPPVPDKNSDHVSAEFVKDMGNLNLQLFKDLLSHPSQAGLQCPDESKRDNAIF